MNQDKLFSGSAVNKLIADLINMILEEEVIINTFLTSNKHLEKFNKLKESLIEELKNVQKL